MPNRIVAMDRNYHVECYKCEVSSCALSDADAMHLTARSFQDCGLKLSSKIAGQECYPLDGHLLCKTCNGNRVRAQTEAN